MSSIHKKAITYDAIFFSPHLDDAALSCGLQIIDLVRRGKMVLVVTFFTTGQEIHSLDIDQFLFGSHAKTASSLFELRKKEDEKVMKKLGAGHLHFDFCDALFRTANNSHQLLYGSFKQVFSGIIKSDDLGLQNQISKSIKQISNKYGNANTTYYAPLGVGNHIDHILVHNSVKKTKLTKVLFWEDVPYQAEATRVISRLSSLSQDNFFYTYKACFLPQYAQLKKAALGYYQSQITGLREAGLSTINYFQEAWYKQANTP